MAQLCWARREVVLLMVRSLTPASNATPTETHPDVDATLLVPTLDAATSEIDKSRAGRLPAGVAPFLARFSSDLASNRSAISSAKKVAPSTLSRGFDFENYPGLSEYLAAAAKETGCVDA